MSVNITNRIANPANREAHFANRLLESANRMANLQIEGEILQIEQSNTADTAVFNRKEDRLIPVTGFGRCDV
ncbi:hypothetical protein JGK52_17225 [Cytobacillus oceanisediminis]|uniref:hypothetical protein n=1 Tax=Cytobacillus oceanisediminis TaxID=665099 RepID=UPI001D1465C3|nr:hypothetical protein [Cytobacillus oceanisediminis]MCC3648408.1 hypothetical protein [Cytobacillus oceanisediminis]